MAVHLVARASTTIDAPIESVWDALVDPEMIKKYMFGTDVVTDWEEGSAIRWQGEWQGKRYEDKGVVLRVRPNSYLQYSHFSPRSGLTDRPENYHTVTIELSEVGDATRVFLSQTNNTTEEAREHSEANWETMLASLKRLLEGDPSYDSAMDPG